MTTTIIELLRHGEVEGEEVFRGSSDTPLSDIGWDQMEAALEGRGDWDVLISSPLLRCQEFANHLAQQHGLSLPLVLDQRLQEIDFGTWENRSPTDVLEEDPELLQHWWNNPTETTPPEGESFLQFNYRVLECWQALLDKYQGKKLLLITHAGVTRTILMHVLGMLDENLFRLDVNYANVSCIRIHHDETGNWASLISHG